MDVELQQRDVVLRNLREQLLTAQNTMKQTYDASRRDVHFNVGDLVLFKLQPYRHLSLAAKRNKKLSPKFFGPFPVASCIGEVANKLEHPVDSRLHPVFHATLPA